MSKAVLSKMISIVAGSVLFGGVVNAAGLATLNACEQFNAFKNETTIIKYTNTFRGLVEGAAGGFIIGSSAVLFSPIMCYHYITEHRF